MAFPVVESTQPTGRTAAETTSPVTYPAVISPGALIVCIARCAVAGAIGWPADWTELVENTFDGSDDVTAIAYKTAVGDEDGTTFNVTHGSGKSAYVVYSITGAANPASQPPELSVSTIGSGTLPDPASLTPTGGVKDYLWLWLGGWEGEQTSPPAGNPTNYTNPLGASTGTGGAVTTNCRVASARRNLNAVSEDPPFWTISAPDDWTAYAMAVHPAPAGAQYTENPRAAASGVSKLALQQALALAPKAASQSKAQAKLTLTYILDRRAPALAEAEPLLQTTFILNPSSRASARALVQIVIPIILTPRARGQAQALPALQELLTLTAATRAAAQARGIAGISYSILVQALARAVSRPSLQEVLTLNPRSRAAAEAEVALQQALSLISTTRVRGLVVAEVGLLFVLTPRAQVGGRTAMPPGQALILTPEGLAEALAQLLPSLAVTITPEVLAEVLAAAAISLPPISRAALVLARAIPSITTMDDILSARIAGFQEDIADLQAQIASLKARTAAEWKI